MEKLQPKLIDWLDADLRRRVARAFCAFVTSHIGSDGMLTLEILRSQKTTNPPPDVQDVCDANQLLVCACDVAIPNFDLDLQSDDQLAFLNGVWELAKEAEWQPHSPLLLSKEELEVYNNGAQTIADAVFTDRGLVQSNSVDAPTGSMEADGDN